ncbi:MAG: alpha-glucuronidase family glycosyl hydrolase [Bacteroidales bacterium]|jgi:alpha-glucuronidase|nr:alpha-glucuronidase family glycosyl hydrolase [Bacteroidales bacterium]
MKKLSITLILMAMMASMSSFSKAEDGYRLWLRYDLISDPVLLEQYRSSVNGWLLEGDSPVFASAAKELQTGLEGLLGETVPQVKSVRKDGTIVAGTPQSSDIIASLKLAGKLSGIGEEGFLILNVRYKRRNVTVITGNTDRGVLYGVFHYLRLMQMHSSLEGLNISSSPKTKIRILNHWDNLDRSVERGYAGLSLWDWEALPGEVSERYTDYARANASIGINATALTNVNANALILTEEYLKKVAVLADVFRSYGLKVYLTARFSAPVEIGGLKTADPLDEDVRKWWKDKADEIYSHIPDFGGFLVKANSEGQPGPQNYGRDHADGANMLADAVAPHGGVVMWRAFVYDNNVPDDRAKQAYNEFVSLDGKFRKNVIVQVKNGPIDFQPREPFHPLFGAMPKTPLMPELQITQEYLGSSVHLVYLAPLFEECLKSDTYARGKGSLVAGIIDGSIEKHELTAIAGVSNIGNVRNWTGHPFAQSNWYAFGRMAWDPLLESSVIANEWIRMTFTNDRDVVEEISRMMMDSREIAVDYMTPLGLHHIMYEGHHYGPGPWVSRGRQDWTSVYYHRADSVGIGFDRTSKGSNAVGQYFKPVRDMYENLETCPENLLLWFHHVPWDYRLKSGNTLWDELCIRYDGGVRSVGKMKMDWISLKESVDSDRHGMVLKFLEMQERDARIWKNACILYFQTFSGKPIPARVEKPDKDLDFYKSHRYNDIPGIR